MPENDEDWEKLAAAVYRAFLQMLPASAMSWFGSLRDRSLAVATEVLPTPSSLNRLPCLWWWRAFCWKISCVGSACP